MWGFMSEQLQAVVSRLSGVRRSGRGYTARCPAHEDRSASLSVCDGEHGVVLKCFAGCATDDVLGAIGLTYSDLYPPRPIANTPAERAQVRQAVRESQWAAALTTLARDTLLVQAAAGMLAKGEPLPASDLDALIAAAARIHDAKETLCGRR